MNIAQSPLTASPPQLDHSTREERQFAEEVEAWLWERSLPDGAVLWFPHWYREGAVEITDVVHLERLIAALAVWDWGGIRKAGDGRWAQAKCMPDELKYLELHPYQHDRPRLPFVWDSFPDLSPSEAAARAWQWVQVSGS